MSCAVGAALLVAVGLGSSVRAEDSIDTTTITDSASTNTVLVVTGMLLLAGLSMVGLTVWYWRTTQPDPEALGPLVTMSRRGFSRLDPIEQRRQLDQLRPSLSVTEPEESAELPEMLPPIVDLPDDDMPADVVSSYCGTADDEPDDIEGLDCDHDRDRDVDQSDRSPLRDEKPVDISWDDDEWPDLDDWSDTESASHESERPAEPERATEPEPRRRPGPIDPLLG